ncbi:hypothetical protein [Methylobacterium sp. Leaf88]|uniref:hypothetical protein n=1 Tax=Methylobacterium sp. Leaf88 TaxID=1736244 RepID=UPI000ACC3F5F|nr:hypothetical protein [Methylobacterium sp. Leaf88]
MIALFVWLGSISDDAGRLFPPALIGNIFSDTALAAVLNFGRVAPEVEARRASDGAV